MEKTKDESDTKLEFEQERKTARITEILVTAMKLRNIKGLINSHQWEQRPIIRLS